MDMPVQQQTPEQTGPQPVNFPYTNAPIPEPFAGGIRASSTHWGRLSDHLQRTLPGFVINNSSNVVGLEQLVAEGMLFKSNGFKLWDADKFTGWKYNIGPIWSIPAASFEKFSKESFSFSKFGEATRHFFNRERAAMIDSAGGTKILTNNLSALSGLTGMSAMAVAAALPDRKDTPEDTERMATMAHDSPLQYTGLRLYQALNPLEWWNNKRQFSGLGMIGAGGFSMLSAFRQIDGEVLGMQTYRTPNWWHAAGSAITTFAGVQLMLAINNQQGWGNYGTTQLFRTTTLPMSIKTRFDKGFSGKAENGAPWYFGGQVVMILKNATASLIGGGHRTKEGEVVSGREMQQEAKEHQHHKKQAHEAMVPKDSQENETPSTRLGETRQREATLSPNPPMSPQMAT